MTSTPPQHLEILGLKSEVPQPAPLTFLPCVFMIERQNKLKLFLKTYLNQSLDFNWASSH